MKKKIRLPSLIVSIAVLMLLGLVGITGTYAWDTHHLSQENNLQSRNAVTSIVESFPDRQVEPGVTKEKEVSFKNDSSVAVFIRVSLLEQWATSSELLTDEIMPEKNWTSAWLSDWELGADGWYYYKKVLPAGMTTDIVLSSVTFPESCFPGADYALEFMVETLQVSDEPLVNEDATLKVFKRQGTVEGMVVENGAVTGGDVTWN